MSYEELDKYYNVALFLIDKIYFAPFKARK